MNNRINGLDKLKGDWENIKRIIPYGAGLEAFRTLKRIIVEFKVPYIVDMDEKKHGNQIFGIYIEPVDRLRDVEEGDKVLITVAKRRYLEIKSILEDYGLRENIDFCHISQFGMEWYYRYRDEFCIFTMDIAVTTFCTLKCKNCNMFIPYYRNPVMYTLEDFKRNVDLLFERIDYVFAIGLLGGEALINPDISRMVEYLDTMYKGQYGSVVVTTNGLTIPDKKILDAFKKHHVMMTISDYRNAIGNRSRLDEVSSLLEENGIIYTIREALVWCDFGFPTRSVQIDDKNARKHMMECDPGWRGLNDGKFYFCNVAWSADKAGLYQLNKNDYIDLRNLKPNAEDTKNTILNYTVGNFACEVFSFCKICGGCGEDNQQYVKAGEQNNHMLDNEE